MTFSSPDIVKLVLGYTVDIESIDVSTYFHNDISIDRQISFKLTSDADKLIGDGIYAGLKKAAEKYKGQISVDAKKTSGSAEYLVKMNAASASQLTDMTRLVLQEKDQTQTGEGSGQPDCSLMTGGAQQPHQPFKKYIRLTDTINFSSFLKGSKVSGGIQYSLKYPRYFKASFTGNTSFENASSDGQNVSCTSYNSIISVGSNAVKWNIEGIAVLIAWLASLTACLVFVFFEFPHILVYIREKRLGVDGAALFSGKNKKRLAFAALCSACFIIMSIRLIFMIY